MFSHFQCSSFHCIAVCSIHVKRFCYVHEWWALLMVGIISCDVECVCSVHCQRSSSSRCIGSIHRNAAHEYRKFSQLFLSFVSTNQLELKNCVFRCNTVRLCSWAPRVYLQLKKIPVHIVFLKLNGLLTAPYHTHVRKYQYHEHCRWTVRTTFIIVSMTWFCLLVKKYALYYQVLLDCGKMPSIWVNPSWVWNWLC